MKKATYTRPVIRAIVSGFLMLLLTFIRQTAARIQYIIMVRSMPSQMRRRAVK